MDTQKLAAKLFAKLRRRRAEVATASSVLNVRAQRCAECLPVIDGVVQRVLQRNRIELYHCDIEAARLAWKYEWFRGIGYYHYVPGSQLYGPFSSEELAARHAYFIHEMSNEDANLTDER